MKTLREKIKTIIFGTNTRAGKLFDEILIKGTKNNLSVFGPQIKHLKNKQLPDNVFIHDDLETFVEQFLTQPVFI